MDLINSICISQNIRLDILQQERKECKYMQNIQQNKLLHKSSLLFILFISFILLDCLLPVSSPALIGIKEGDAPKNIVLNDINGKMTDISVHYGKKPIVLVFWELPLKDTFLDYSLDELNYLTDIYKKYHKKNGLEIFAIYTPEEEKDITDAEISRVQELISVNNVEFPVLIDKAFKFFREYGVIALPTTIMINKSGTIQFIYPSFPLAGRPIVSNEIKNLIGIETRSGDKEKTLSKGDDSHANRLYRYALQMYKKGLLEQSLSPLKKLIDLDPDNMWFHNLMGIILWEKGNLDRSADNFRSAIKLDRNSVAVRLNYTVLLIEQGNYKEANEILLSLSQIHNEHTLMRNYLLGMLYKRTDMIDKAIHELEAAYAVLEEISSSTDKLTKRHFSFRTSILHDLSLLYDAKGDDKKAQELLHQAFHYLRGLQGDPFTEGLRQIKHLMFFE